MKVIRTMVVDDEPYIRKSIIKSIETANPLFSVIGEAGDGLAALEIIQEQSPDVLFIDINMPIMDGLSLLKEVHKLNKIPVCVILSGYSDFKYAQTAIEYQVHNYLLKPIAPTDLRKVLASIQKRFSVSLSENQYHYFNHIFRGTKLKLNQDEIKHSFMQYQTFYPFIINFGSYMIVKNNQFSFPDKLNYVTYLEQVWTKIGIPHASQWIIPGENSNEKIVIIGYEDNFTNQGIPEFIKGYYKELTTLNLPVTLITGKWANELSSLVPNIIDIKYAYPSIIKYGYSTLASYEDKTSCYAEQVNCTTETINLLRSLRDSDNKYEFLQLVKTILHNCQTEQVSQSLLQSMSKLFLLIALNETYSRDNEAFVDELVTNTYSYDVFINEYIKFLSQVIRYQDLESYGDTINAIKAYIDEHFTEELSLNLLSNKFHISISHFSVQFKKRFQVSPNEFIIMKRIERAKILLQIDPPLSIKQISGMVGYVDQYYFSRIFKSVSGQSPTDYQSKYNGKKNKN